MTPPPIDLTTAEGARAWLLDLKRDATEAFRKNGTITVPMVTLLAMRDDRSGLALPAPRQVIAFIDPAVMKPTGDSKDKFALALRRMVRVNDAIAYAFTMESWVLPDTDIKPRGSWENVPGRREAITIMAQHKALGDETLAFHRDITRDKHGAPKLAPWRQGRGTHGRFAGVLPDNEEREDVDRLEAVLLAAGADLTPEQRRFHIERAHEQMLARGASPIALDGLVRKTIARLRAAGQEIAGRPGDIVEGGTQANDAGPTLDLVDLDEWGK